MSSDIVSVILLSPNSKSQEAYKNNICFGYYRDYQLKDTRENRLITSIPSSIRNKYYIGNFYIIFGKWTSSVHSKQNQSYS